MEFLNIKILNTAVERLMNQELAELGLTYTQTTVIGYLFDNDGREVCQKDIEDSLGLTHPTMSSILSRMEKNGFLTTEPSSVDRRYKTIRLTPKATELRAAISEKYQRLKTVLYQGISEEDRAVFEVVLRTMLQNLR